MQGKERFNQRHPNEKTIVHPTKHQYVHTSSESVINHIHPIHTTYVNHPVVKNQHPHPYGFVGRPQMNPHPPFPSAPITLPGQIDPGYRREIRRPPNFHARRHPGIW